MNTERFTFGGVTLEVRGQDAWTVSKASARFHAEDGAETNHVISVEYSPTPPPVPDHAVKNGPVSRWREGDALHTLRVYGARQFSYAVRTQGQTRLVFGEGYRSTMYSQAILESADMFDILAGSRFNGNDDDEAKDRASYILDCDLLIIDDLGTELINTFTASQMFYCVNERLNRNKGTIISTNLTLGELQDAFTERVTSRIMSRYKIIPLIGDDIRLVRRGFMRRG